MNYIIQGLKEWPAFHDLKKIIDDFTDICPILELMSNKEIFSLCSNNNIIKSCAILVYNMAYLTFSTSYIIIQRERG